MRGRPKLDDSRTHQYRVRLNDEEREMLEYASAKTGKPKSRIFRDALVSYCNTVRLNDANSELHGEWEDGSISLRRVVKCPQCGFGNIVDLEEYSETTSCERQMGAETLYEFDFECPCDGCGANYQVSGYVSEYPVGAFDHEEIKVKPVEKEG